VQQLSCAVLVDNRRSGAARLAIFGRVVFVSTDLVVADNLTAPSAVLLWEQLRCKRKRATNLGESVG
jgi:hypothetical protein